ncbi:AraC family transcriptional regulator [Neorhizobium lilium]|uniref:AraC family transcriptional regulator n=1 Tax=Neorhizobium lilium TaxID=2503024 RepID=A0A444LN90_9HYPH|nr:helix-turn-helix transcriptional regulator [Neorhizobium lilium]RWX81764.1 AraC family transcriptional regulator [Neorhizobium lilium]
MYFDADYAEGVGRYFGIPAAPVLKAVPIRSAGFSVTRIDRDVAPGNVQEIVFPASEAYFMMLYLETVSHADIIDGKSQPVCSFPAGTICLVDLQEGASIALHSSLHSLAFTLPRSLLDEVAWLSPERPLRGLRCVRGYCDPVISNIGMALVPLFAYPQASAEAILQHIAVALCDHLMTGYTEETEAFRNRPPGVKTLAVWQQRTAKTFMQDNMEAGVTVAMVADSVGLSPNHFSRLFRAAMGVTAHQWLIRTRLERAKDLLRDPSLSLKEIAQTCGFSDHSYFSKVFAKYTGLRPADWRRVRSH